MNISAVFGRLDLGQIDRGKASFGVGRERNAQRFDQDFGGERGAILEEIDEDLVSHGGHGSEIRTGAERSATWWRISRDGANSSVRAVIMDALFR
jgi:hypothetical protein